MIAIAFWIVLVPVTLSLIVFLTAVFCWLRDEIDRVKRVHEIATWSLTHEPSNRRLR